MIKDILVLENFIEKDFLQLCVDRILFCEIKSADQSFYMDGEDRRKM